VATFCSSIEWLFYFLIYSGETGSADLPDLFKLTFDVMVSFTLILLSDLADLLDKAEADPDAPRSMLTVLSVPEMFGPSFCSGIIAS